MLRPSWAPAEIDLSRPSAARVYDYYLGGFHNFAADREMAQEAIRLWPELPMIMSANRAFLRRAVRFAVHRDVTQFLDIGAGIPTVGSSHEIAQREDPEARIAYVDIDPVAVAHSRAILAGNATSVVLQGDLRDPDQIVGDPSVLGTIDFDRPVAILLVAVLHFVGDADDPGALIARLHDAVAPGSLLIVSHASQDGQQELAATHQQLYDRTATPMTMRSQSEIRQLFGDFELLEPGVVPIESWHPESDSESDLPDSGKRMVGFAGVGIKRIP